MWNYQGIYVDQFGREIGLTNPRDEVAEKFKVAAEKLERAAAHCRIAAQHYAAREVARGCAHAFAAIGDIALANQAIGENAGIHASKAQIELDPGPPNAGSN